MAVVESAALESAALEDGAAPFWGRALERLVSRYGVVNTVQRLPPLRGLPDYHAIAAMLGRDASGGCEGAEQTTATGRSLGEPALARALALAEAAERYAAWEPADPAYTWATPAELQGRGRVLRYADLPACSAQEYAHPQCPVRPFDPDARIRWVRGFDFLTGEPVWVPACMASYRLPSPEPAERFWYPISTGHAVHTDPAAAVFAAVAEVVERDAIALLWLRRLPLPRIPAAALGAQAAPLLDWCADHHVTASVFDATTDIGLPTAYCVLSSPFDPVLRTLVGCSSGLSIEQTAAKALLDVVSIRSTKSTAVAAPERYEDFHTVSDGARYMGTAAREHAFEFLLGERDDRPRFEDRGTYAPDLPRALRRLGRTFAEADMEVILVDRGRAELREAGLSAVCALIPKLMPMSLRPLARFTAHPRLFSGPARMGYGAGDCGDDINPLPQPFA